MSDQRAGPARQTTERKPVVVGLVAVPGLPLRLARRLARELPGILAVHLPEFSGKFTPWHFHIPLPVTGVPLAVDPIDAVDCPSQSGHSL
jgi:hypothetical protein